MGGGRWVGGWRMIERGNELLASERIVGHAFHDISVITYDLNKQI